MTKWLTAATVVVLALLALLWLQIREPAAAVTPAPREVAADPVVTGSPHNARELAVLAQKAREAQERGDKVDPASDSFTYRFDERVSPMLTMQAAKCYQGGLNRVHRNQKVKLGYKIQIKDGVVSVHDIKVLESTINDKTLVDCFVREVAATTWTDDKLPDWLQDDELVIRPERGMKKFTAENMAYEGDGPIGKLEAPVGPVAASREEPIESPDAESAATPQN